MYRYFRTRQYTESGKVVSARDFSLSTDEGKETIEERIIRFTDSDVMVKTRKKAVKSRKNYTLSDVPFKDVKENRADLMQQYTATVKEYEDRIKGTYKAGE